MRENIDVHLGVKFRNPRLDGSALVAAAGHDLNRVAPSLLRGLLHGPSAWRRRRFSDGTFHDDSAVVVIYLFAHIAYRELGIHYALIVICPVTRMFSDSEGPLGGLVLELEMALFL